MAGRSGGSQDAVRDGETGVVIDNPRSVAELAAAIATLARRRRHVAIDSADARSKWRAANFDWDCSRASSRVDSPPTTTIGPTQRTLA